LPRLGDMVLIIGPVLTEERHAGVQHPVEAAGRVAGALVLVVGGAVRILSVRGGDTPC